MKRNTELARELRKNLTPQEKKLWNLLRNHQFYGFEFRRQYPIAGYIVDFICRKAKIIIELDGGQHNRNGNIEYDLNRTKVLNGLGYEVIRFWNVDVDDNIEGVYATLQKVFGVKDQPPP